MSFFKIFFSLALSLGLGTAAWGQGLLEKAAQVRQEVSVPQAHLGLLRVGQVQAELVAEPSAIRPGETFAMALRLVHDPHWHTYWRNPGDSGLPTKIDWKLAAGWQVGPVQWPTPKRLAVGPLASFGYEDDVLLMVQARAPAALKPGTSVDVSAQVSWLMCKDVCIPGQALVGLRLPVVDAGAAPAQLSAHAPAFSRARGLMPTVDSDRKLLAHIQGKQIVISWKEPAVSTPGFFFPYLEGLITPPAAQRLSQTESGYRLDLELSESPETALGELRRAGKLSGVWVENGRPGMEWHAPLSSSVPAVATKVLDAGRTAQQESPSAQSLSQAQSRAAFGSGPGWNAFLFALLGALLGGVILNAMPCVFPVIGLKVLSFAKSAHSPAAALRHAFIFSAGVIATFMLLAALLIGLRAAGQAVGWGFQLQNPAVVLSLALLFVAIATNLAGFFETGLVMSRLGNLNFSSQEESSLSTFGSGVLAVVVASPCTAPFMGSAVGFTATASITETLAVFAALGVGMSLPYVLLSVWPGLLARLPRPGPWMLRFKQAMAFPMLAAAAWLFWVLATLQGPDIVLGALMSGISLALALWIYGAYVQSGRAGVVSLVFMLLAAVFSIWCAWLVVKAQPAVVDSSRAQTTFGPNVAASSSQARTLSGSDWKPWAPGRPEAEQASGKTVFVDFTASWCISCQANKVRVLQSESIVKAFEENGVVLLRADWTRQDATIAQELARHGRAGVPLYLVYKKSGGAPKILSEWLTEKEVLAAIR